MIIYQICPSCNYKNHISFFGRSKDGTITYLVCPECNQKFLPISGIA